MLRWPSITRHWQSSFASKASQRWSIFIAVNVKNSPVVTMVLVCGFASAGSTGGSLVIPGAVQRAVEHSGGRAADHRLESPKPFRSAAYRHGNAPADELRRPGNALRLCPFPLADKLTGRNPDRAGRDRAGRNQGIAPPAETRRSGGAVSRRNADARRPAGRVSRRFHHAGQTLWCGHPPGSHRRGLRRLAATSHVAPTGRNPRALRNPPYPRDHRHHERRTSSGRGQAANRTVLAPATGTSESGPSSTQERALTTEHSRTGGLCTTRNSSIGVRHSPRRHEDTKVCARNSLTFDRGFPGEGIPQSTTAK